VLAGVETKSDHFTQAPTRGNGPYGNMRKRLIPAWPDPRPSGQITLIAIGPLVNIQAAIERDPATFRKLKRVVLMGGSVYRGYDGNQGDRNTPPSPEWNILCDPAGARELLASGVPVFDMPLDPRKFAWKILAWEVFAHGSPLTDQLTLLYHQWTAKAEWHSPTLSTRSP